MKHIYRIGIYLPLLLILAVIVHAEPRQLVAGAAIDGASLYQQHCSACHNSLADTDKPQRSARRIRSSIRHFPSMVHLAELSDAETDAIAASLKTISFDN